MTIIWTLKVVTVALMLLQYQVQVSPGGVTFHFAAVFVEIHIYRYFLPVLLMKGLQ